MACRIGVMLDQTVELRCCACGQKVAVVAIEATTPEDLERLASEMGAHDKVCTGRPS